MTQAAGTEVLRVSAYFYNRFSEIRLFYEALDELVALMGLR